MTLRQRHTEGAILYEKKLKPFMKSMNDGKESCPLSNTSFPHMIPLLSLLERGVAVVEGAESWESVDAGVDVVMSHLEAARTIAHHGGIYHTNAETKLQGFQARAEVLEVFCTEFQMRLLWGSRGAEGSQGERYEKFDKVLTALSNKLEPPKELKAWVEGNLTACARSVFVFDEMDKMPPGLIDVLVPFLGSSHVVYQTNYRKAIYVFISTAGEEQINRLALEARRAGRDREEIRLEELEDAIAQAVFNKSCNGFYHSEIIQEKLVDCFVPFLPLTRRHVERCVHQELCLRGQCHRRDIIEAITGAMTFSPERERLFSHSGCKTVPAKVNYYL
ncbi:UNVERIFIED_CONTAM: hypothetical protein FKN15_028729 [Acipenser sinensis]